MASFWLNISAHCFLLGSTLQNNTLFLSLSHTHTVALQRKALLVKRYKELKESGQLDRVLRKRRKRNAAKEKKRMLPRRSMT